MKIVKTYLNVYLIILEIFNFNVLAASFPDHTNRLDIKKSVIKTNIKKNVTHRDTASDKNNHSIKEEATTVDDTKVLLENLRDIAYYLRNFKFNEYDRRYETDPATAHRIYYKTFPKPPLRSLHWEVHQFCEPSFRDCVNYLAKKLRYTSLKRADDTAVIMDEQKWSWKHNQQQIEQVDVECLKNKRIDDTVADPFEGPLERFQWRVTASYYMCWYTLQKTPEMKRLYEKCDNFASCLDYDFGPRNDDDRVEDWIAFSCAMYSFCPDPCCPFKHIDRMKDCWNSPENPCFRSNSLGKRKCNLNMTQNVNFNDIILNRWNVSCRCPLEGYEWNSRYGICIDVDECASKTHNCHLESASCLNLPGSFRCICRWGYIRDKKKQKCLPSQALSVLKLSRKQTTENVHKITLWQKFKNVIFRRNSGNLIFSFNTTIAVFLLLITLLVF